MSPKFPDTVVDVTNIAGDPRAMMSEVSNALAADHVDEDDVDQWVATFRTDSYFKMLRQVHEWVTVEGRLQVTTPPCPWHLCGKKSQVTADARALCEWAFDGKLIQNAFPGESPEWRDHFKLGLHPECSEKLFGKEE